MENLQEAVVPKMLCAKYLQPNTLQLAQGFIQFLWNITKKSLIKVFQRTNIFSRTIPFTQSDSRKYSYEFNKPFETILN